ncbi:hypothetical protein DFH08DRAFT_968836 [Mycena albidolilacea]|uniref:Uncharacterized protein n=1 Tax=Mycena albidolilacea TaxID=1033008 RepID=A0AAD6ZI70_9AGAR|nr:hypothetical protein DFH08DRAFT_968836 [Mycena albidolilacea]
MDPPPQVGLKESRLLPLTQQWKLPWWRVFHQRDDGLQTGPIFAGMKALEALGNPGWGWNDFLPFMQKSETIHPPDAEQRADGADYFAAVHGFEGPVGVSFTTPFVAPALQAAGVNTSEIIYNGGGRLSQRPPASNLASAASTDCALASPSSAT